MEFTMKHLLLVALLSIMVFAADKQIIIGSYLQGYNAVNESEKLNEYIKNDEKLQNLIKINSLHVESKKIENYYVVSIFVLSDYVQLLRTLESLQVYYPDAYVLDVSAVVIQMPEVQTVKVDKIAKKLQEATPTKTPIVKPTPIVKAQTATVDKKEYIEYLLAILALIGLAYIIFKRKKADKED